MNVLTHSKKLNLEPPLITLGRERERERESVFVCVYVLVWQFVLAGQFTGLTIYWSLSLLV